MKKFMVLSVLICILSTIAFAESADDSIELNETQSNVLNEELTEEKKPITSKNEEINLELSKYKNELESHFDKLNSVVNNNLMLATAIFTIIVASNMFVSISDRNQLKKEMSKIEDLKEELENKDNEIQKELLELKVNNLVNKAHKIMQQYKEQSETDTIKLEYLEDGIDDLEIALEILQEAINLDDGHFDAYILKGNCLTDLKRATEAIDSYKSAYELSTSVRNKMISLIFIANTYHLKLQKKNKAKKYYEKILADLDSENRVVLWNLGEIYQFEFNYSEALNCYWNVIQKSILNNVDDIIFEECIINFLGVYYYNSVPHDSDICAPKQLEKVEELLEERLSNTPYFKLFKAKRLLNIGSKSEAKDLFEEVFSDFEPDVRYMAFSWDFTATIAELKMYDYAIEAIKEYMKLNPQLEIVDLEKDERFSELLKSKRHKGRLDKLFA